MEEDQFVPSKQASYSSTIIFSLSQLAFKEQLFLDQFESMVIYLTYVLCFYFRSLVQIKSHAQKVLKRIEIGENVFRRLEENFLRVNVLVSEIHQAFGLDHIPIALSSTVIPSIQKERNKNPTFHSQIQPSTAVQTPHSLVDTNATVQIESHASEGTEHILAASALCQLATPDESMDPNRSRMLWRN
jgi:hypothetical protein